MTKNDIRIIVVSRLYKYSFSMEHGLVLFIRYDAEVMAWRWEKAVERLQRFNNIKRVAGFYNFRFNLK